MDLDFNFKFRVVAQISKQSEFSGLILCTGHSSLILLFQCMNGADQTGRHSSLILLFHRMNGADRTGTIAHL
jgi:hypothetical protein